MTVQKIIDKAKYLIFPYFGKEYLDYNLPEGNEKIYLPLTDLLYHDWPINKNHYLPEYHQKFVYPTLEQLLNINLSEDNFIITEKHYKSFDLTRLEPKQQPVFDVVSFTRNETLKNLSYKQLYGDEDSWSEYHALYKFSHECSRIINKTNNDTNKRTLFISGDSQMIPSILPLACVFSEVWYFDNRVARSFADYLSESDFTDVLFELNCSPLERYTHQNFFGTKPNKQTYSKTNPIHKSFFN